MGNQRPQQYHVLIHSFNEHRNKGKISGIKETRALVSLPKYFNMGDFDLHTFHVEIPKVVTSVGCISRLLALQL